MQRTRASSGSGLWSEMAVNVCETVVSGYPEQVRAYPVSGRGLRA